MHRLLDAIKTIATEAVNANEPTALMIGEVLTVGPLSVLLANGAILNEKFLIISTLVSDFDVDMTVDHLTEDRSGGGGESSFASHNHEYKGTKTFKVLLGLKVGEKVVMLRVQGGQSYYIIDRVRG